jgi:hypothetical protein
MIKIPLLLVLCCLLGFFGISFSGIPNSEIHYGQASFEWLLGTWKRTNDKEGLQTYEHWKKISESEFLGKGYTMKEADTVWQEKIKLIRGEDSWNFEVHVKNSVDPTIFRLTKVETNSFTCENTDNDFPKKIRYAKVEKGLNAVISGDGKVVLFEFIRLP